MKFFACVLLTIALLCAIGCESTQDADVSVGAVGCGSACPSGDQPCEKGDLCCKVSGIPCEDTDACSGACAPKPKSACPGTCGSAGQKPCAGICPSQK